jgi:outer membrane protein TolC
LTTNEKERKMKRRIFFSIFFLTVFVFQEKYVFPGDMRLTLKNAVELGVLKNRDVIIEKYLHKIALEKILETKGIFDPVLSSTLEGVKAEVPIAEIFYPNGFYKEEAARTGLNLKGKVFSGADYGVDFFLERYTTTSQVVTLTPRYSTRLELSLVQPFLKDFGESITKTKIRIAETGTKATKLDVKDRVVKTVNVVEEAYWNLVYGWKNLDLQKESLNLIRRLFSDTEVKVKAGELAPLNLIEAKTGVAQQEENVISAENELKKAEHDLKLVLGIPEDEDTIIPADQPKEIEKIPNLTESLDLAQKNRPDLQASKFRVDQKKFEEKYYSNQLLPRLDFIGKYGKRGLSGSPSTVIGSNGLPIGSAIPGTPYEGKTSIWESLEDVVPTYGFEYWSVGLKLEIPLGNRAAEGRYRQTKLERMKMETETKSLDEKISNEVKKGFLDVKTTAKSREAAKVTVEFSEERLNVEEKRFKAGVNTSYDVLRIQRELTDAKTRHLKALIEYNKAWSKVRAAEGISLDEYEIEFNEKM